jgi:hypothetical protein
MQQAAAPRGIEPLARSLSNATIVNGSILCRTSGITSSNHLSTSVQPHSLIIAACSLCSCEQEACAAVGVQADVLSSAEAMAAFRQLQLPHTSTCLLQQQGGLLEPGKAAAAAQQLAQQAGVQMMVCC